MPLNIKNGAALYISNMNAIDGGSNAPPPYRAWVLSTPSHVNFTAQSYSRKRRVDLYTAGEISNVACINGFLATFGDGDNIRIFPHCRLNSIQVETKNVFMGRLKGCQNIKANCHAKHISQPLAEV